MTDRVWVFDKNLDLYVKGELVSILYQALENLNGSLNNLESTVTGLESSVAGQQRDMFGYPSDSPASNENAKIDPAVVAQRLDIAIERVEQVLSEAASA